MNNVVAIQTYVTGCGIRIHIGNTAAGRPIPMWKDAVGALSRVVSGGSRHTLRRPLFIVHRKGRVGLGFGFRVVAFYEPLRVQGGKLSEPRHAIVFLCL